MAFGVNRSLRYLWALKCYDCGFGSLFLPPTLYLVNSRLSTYVKALLPPWRWGVACGIGERGEESLWEPSLYYTVLCGHWSDRLFSSPHPQHTPTGCTRGDPQILRNLHLHEHFQRADIMAGCRHAQKPRSLRGPWHLGTHPHACLSAHFCWVSKTAPVLEKNLSAPQASPRTFAQE